MSSPSLSFSPLLLLAVQLLPSANESFFLRYSLFYLYSLPPLDRYSYCGLSFSVPLDSFLSSTTPSSRPLLIFRLLTHSFSFQRLYHVECTASRLSSAVKQRGIWLVAGLVGFLLKPPLLYPPLIQPILTSFTQEVIMQKAHCVRGPSFVSVLLLLLRCTRRLPINS